MALHSRAAGLGSARLAKPMATASCVHRVQNAWLCSSTCQSQRPAHQAGCIVAASSSCCHSHSQGTSTTSSWRVSRSSSRCRAFQQGGVAEFVMTPESEEARTFAVAMAKVASDTKVQDLVVLHVEPLISWTSYMVICTVFSKPQLQAVLSRMETAAAEDWDRQKQNSVGSSPWEVMDFGDVVVHVFTQEQRDFYDIESFYAAAEEVDLPFEVESGAAASSSNNSGSSSRAGPSWSKEEVA